MLGHEEEHDEEAVVDASLLEKRAAPQADEWVLQHPHRRDGEVERHHHRHPCTAPAQRPDEPRQFGGEERRGALPSLAPGSGAAVEKTPKPLPPHARIVQPRRSAPLACSGKGGVGV